MATANEYCKYEFAAEELREMTDQLVGRLQDKARKEGQKKEVAAQFKAEIEKLENECTTLAGNIRNKYEYRYITCDIVEDFARGEVRYIRTDNGEVARTRTMTVEERQESLRLDGELEAEGDLFEGAGGGDPEGAEGEGEGEEEDPEEEENA